MRKGLTLFVFEGPKPENVVAEGLFKEFMEKPLPLVCVFGTVIYTLYKRLADDSYLNLVEVLRETNNDNAKTLAGLTDKDFADIYMFFDYDGHATNASDHVVADMLAFFNEETEYGKLYVSYPMVEALRHYPDPEAFMNLTVKCKRGRCGRHLECADLKACNAEEHYKKVSKNECRPELVNWGLYGRDEWGLLIREHVLKANSLVNGVAEWPDDIMGQDEIFAVQKKDYIDRPCPHVAVLSGFPLFVLDYYGSNRLSEKLGISY